MFSWFFNTNIPNSIYYLHLLQGLQNHDDKRSRLEFLLNENAPAILYSYLRPMITTITLDANLPPLVIPLMNFREQNQTK